MKTIGFLIFFASIRLAFGAVDVKFQKNSETVWVQPRQEVVNEKLRTDLSSGIATRFAVYVRLIELPSEIIKEDIRSFEIQYDLWDEIFNIKYLDQNSNQSIKPRIDVESFINSPGPWQLIPIARLKENSQYVVEVIQSINPVDQKQLESVQLWLKNEKISTQKTSATAIGTPTAVARETTLSALFRSLWNRAASGEILEGEIKKVTRSEPFKLSDLKGPLK